jgi:hypothetical protein
MWGDSTIDLEVWQAQAVQLFGTDPDQWKFQCPSCLLAQSRADFISLGLSPRQADHIAGYSCIRRWQDQGCMAAGNGPVLLRISEGEIRNTFQWAT